MSNGTNGRIKKISDTLPLKISTIFYPLDSRSATCQPLPRNAMLPRKELLLKCKSGKVGKPDMPLCASHLPSSFPHTSRYLRKQHQTFWRHKLFGKTSKMWGDVFEFHAYLCKYIELSSNSNVEYVVELSVCFEFHFCAWKSISICVLRHLCHCWGCGRGSRAGEGPGGATPQGSKCGHWLLLATPCVAYYPPIVGYQDRSY